MAKIIEIEFKGGRKSFYANPQEFPFTVGDLVIVEVEKGEDIGRVINLGSLVDKRAGNRSLPQVIRKPGKKDIIRKNENTTIEEEAFKDCLKRITEHGLEMKLVDVEYQFDRNKTTFYFTSENRVDFRALVRDLARKHHTRIELRQIGVRDEAKRIGGIGICGRGLCCSSFLREFEPVVTQLAKDQNLALNPTKLSGCCGRLMCCLRYEEEFYSDMLKKFPSLESKLRTAKGTGRIFKIDIFTETAVIKYESGEEDILTLQQINDFLKRKPEKNRHKSQNKKQHKEKPGETDDQKNSKRNKQNSKNQNKDKPKKTNPVEKPKKPGEKNSEKTKNKQQKSRDYRKFRQNRKKKTENKKPQPN